jgi:hypothetical protein
MRLETNNVRARSSDGIFQLMVIKIVIVNIRLSLVASNRSGSVVIDYCHNSLGFFVLIFFNSSYVFFTTCVKKVNFRLSIIIDTQDFRPLMIHWNLKLFKTFSFYINKRGRVGVWDKASFRKRCSGAPWDQGSNPVVSIVGWSYTRSGATVASFGPRDLLQERQLGRVGWGTVFVDIGIGPIFLSRRKRQMKCGIMGNWCCISDSARCPCLRSHWVNCLVSAVLNWECVAYKWVLALYV